MRVQQLLGDGRALAAVCISSWPAGRSWHVQLLRLVWACARDSGYVAIKRLFLRCVALVDLAQVVLELGVEAGLHLL